MNNSGLAVDIKVAHQDFGLQVREQFSTQGVTALFGPSGAGKTTLLRVVAGLEVGAAGRLAIADSIWLDSDAGVYVPPHQRGIGYVFQDGRLFSHLDVAGNLNFAWQRRRKEATAATTPPGPTLAEVVTTLELDSLLQRPVTTLSGGERQRVAIGRALLGNPRLLLFDEPLAAIDLMRKHEILSYIERVSETFRVPLLYVSHSVDEVARLADQVVVLNGGRIAARGTATEVLERLDLQPLTGRAEAGVLLDATVVSHDEEFHLTQLSCCGQALLVPGLLPGIGGQVRLRVLARDVALATNQPQDTSIRNCLAGHILSIEQAALTPYAEVLLDINGAHVRSRVTRAAVADLGLVESMPVFALLKSVALTDPLQDSQQT